ncbi:hypothetical protein AEAC466_08505 [Asticcacaulis sp. AC466]|uniref:LptF/LptG family permease n=1 Tax=Asticcacaulis sp. AC466 TaxID=1282362 RepID=UPI0003C3CEBF|nr:LptF/LptG family permease [Asticcacaulis sp. AC466]ESQ84385.1 hypothetical protein AEAC466_08505 [Asticcacaulis sp. AC466]
MNWISNLPLVGYLTYLNPWRKSRLETYILQTCVSAFLSAVMVVSSLIFLIEYVGISKSLGAKDEVSGLSIIGLMLEKSPGSILILLPFAFLFGSLFAFVNLNRRSELIAMRAAGVSAWRFVLPASILAFAFGLLTIGILNPVASILSDTYDKSINQLNAADTVPDKHSGAIYLRQGDGQQQVVIRAERQEGPPGHLLGVTFWIYDIDAKQTPIFRKRIDAQEATLGQGGWTLKNAREATVSGPAVPPYDLLGIPSNLDPQKAFRKYASTQAVPFWRLPGLIYQNKISGFSTAMYELKLHQLLSTPLMFAAMTALGAVFSLRLMRLGGLTGLIISGISLGFVIFFVNQLFSSMGKAGVIPIFLAGWSPPILAMLAAMTLIVYTEDG